MQKQTALITGASVGIGLELAKQFARGGFDLVLVARREDKLRELAALLEKHVAVTVLPADLSENGAARRIFERLEGRAIDVLANNAGFGDYGPFSESDEAKMLEMLQINVVALTHLTRLFLPMMLERKRGKILNVASTAAFLPGPLMSVYYASKAYVLSFSEALAHELKGSGVCVTALCPGPTTSDFQARAAMEGSKVMESAMMDAKTVAVRGYRALMRGQTVCVPGLLNQILVLAPRVLTRKKVAEVVARAQGKIGA